MTDDRFIEQGRKPVNYLASIGINLLVIVLYAKFILKRDGFLGLALIYFLASLICIFVYRLRRRTVIVDCVLGGCLLIGMLYALWYEKSWYLMAEIVMTTTVIFSVTYYFFDWKSLDEGAISEKIVK